jgi:hypothetical protein
MLHLYVRREPTTDNIILPFTHKKRDVVFYEDEACNKFYCRIPWHYKGKPIRTSKRYMLNCCMRELTWVPDIPLPGKRRTAIKQ